jgi:acetyl-CoA carboxylase biotin carboxyl carrier protein
VPRLRKSVSRRPAKGVKALAPSADNSVGATSDLVPLAELRRLIQLVQSTGIGELEVSSGGRTIRISAHAAGSLQVAMSPSSGNAPASSVHPASTAAEAKSSEPSKSDKLVAITSPMVGTFYRAPAPDADPYVEIGDMVEVGQTVCIVEAMKLMNEIESEVRGRVVQILVDNSHPVEFGQKLFMIEPA